LQTLGFIPVAVIVAADADCGAIEERVVIAKVNDKK
jgi:hypothetical protein